MISTDVIKMDEAAWTLAGLCVFVCELDKQVVKLVVKQLMTGRVTLAGIHGQCTGDCASLSYRDGL